MSPFSRAAGVSASSTRTVTVAAAVWIRRIPDGRALGELEHAVSVARRTAVSVAAGGCDRFDIKGTSVPGRSGADARAPRRSLIFSSSSTYAASDEFRHARQSTLESPTNRRFEMTESKGATRITQVGTVIVPVSDQEKALEFYVGTLGFEKRLDAPFGEGGRWVEVAPPGATTTIALVLTRDGNPTGMEVSFTTQDAEADHAELHARGVEADAEVLRLGAGVPPMFTFRDPDGNRFRMVQRS
jgi:catechol 2,3-dioxygenase-like lactoylglutathione lyase family enzyme